MRRIFFGNITVEFCCFESVRLRETAKEAPMTFLKSFLFPKLFFFLLLRNCKGGHDIVDDRLLFDKKFWRANKTEFFKIQARYHCLSRNKNDNDFDVECCQAASLHPLQPLVLKRSERFDAKVLHKHVQRLPRQRVCFLGYFCSYSCVIV